MFDVCPNCGVLVQEYMAGNTRQSDSPADEDRPTAELQRAPESEVAEIEGMSVVNVSLKGSDDSTPIEIPLFESVSGSAKATRRPVASVRGDLETQFVWAENVQAPTPSAEALGEDVIPGMPIDSNDNQLARPYHRDAWCTSCATPMEPDLRHVYDSRSGRFSLQMAGIFFLLGFVGAFSLTLFNGYSFARLLVVYGTGMMLMGAAVFMTVGVLMLLAKERVFRCHSCDLVSPRA
jgi:hypothetical protein